MALELLKGKQLAKKDGSLVDADKVFADNKVVCLYFSAHWCPPCRGFTPVLKEFYEEIQNDGIAIIFISSDRSDEEMSSYFQKDHGDYYCLPYVDRDTKQSLQAKFEVKGIPSLVVLKGDGSEVSKNGRADVMNKAPPACLRDWSA